MSKRNKSKTENPSVKTAKQTLSRKEPTPLQLVFSFLTAPVK
jgi:hypothetical protein